MIAKSDLLILTVSSGLLIFTLMRTAVETDNGYRSEARPSNKAVTQVIGMQSTSSSNTGSANSASSNEVEQTITQIVQPIETTVETTIEFEEPDVIREAAFKTHIVKSGEYLGLLANRYNTTVDELRSLNNLNGSTIFIGQKLVYPGI